MGGGFGGKESQSAPVRLRGGGGGAPAAAPGQAAARPRRRLHDHRPAPLLLVRLRGRLRRRRPHARRRDHHGLARRPLGRPVGAGDDARAVPLRQRLLAARRGDARLLAARPTRRATPPSAASAGRRARSRSRTSSTAIARKLGRDPLDVRRVNFYGTDERNVTPYVQTVTDNIIARAGRPNWRQAATTARAAHAIAAFNATSPVLKRGIALTPVKFGISFNVAHFNQAGALVHVYNDGSILVNHGGTEMGQGLNTKVAQVVAHELGVRFERVRVDRDRHDQGRQHLGHGGVHRHRPERQGGAGRGAPDPRAARRLRRRAPRRQADRRALRQRQGRGQRPHARLRRRWWARPTSTACSCGRTASTPRPACSWNRETLQGPAVLLLRLRRGGERGGRRHAHRRVEAAARRHPARRRPLAEPGHRHRPDRGRLHPGHGLAHDRGAGVAPDKPASCRRTRRAPTRSRRPTTARRSSTSSCSTAPTPRTSIHRSKAVGEPPLLLPFSVFFAIRDAVSAAGGHRVDPPLRAPATSEAILDAIIGRA